MSSKPVKDPNGTTRALKIPREKSRLQRNSKNIVAIDFGTKNCSVAYITENDKLEITKGIPKLPLNGSYLRVPTAILFTPEGKVESFGHDARTLYLNLDDSDRELYVYFEEIKMNLHKDQVWMFVGVVPVVMATIHAKEIVNIEIAAYMYIHSNTLLC